MFKKFFTALVLGINSGLTYALLGSTLTAYLNDMKIPLATIGLLTLRTMPYSLKPLWAPVVDNARIAIFPIGFGQRKSWMMANQSLLVVLIMALGFIDINQSFPLFCFTAFMVAFFAATYDIAMEAYRIEFFKGSDLSKGNSFVIMGFRIGLVLSGACGLYLSSLIEWKWVFIIIALLILPCMATIYHTEDHKTPKPTQKLKGWLRLGFTQPFMVFFRQPGFYLVFLLVAFYKVGDSYLDAMLMPFLFNIGFSKLEVASLTNAVAVVASIVGVFTGAHLINKYHIMKVLLYAELFASATNLLFIPLALVGNNAELLFVVAFIESFCSGICNVILISYMSSLCHREFTATHYAILASISGLSRVIMASTSGFVAAKMGWVNFFIISSLLSIPSIICICFLYPSQKSTVLSRAFQKTK